MPPTSFARFGDAHELVIRNDANIDFDFRSDTLSNANFNPVFQIQPAADFFVIDNLSLGGLVDFTVFDTSVNLGPLGTVSATSVVLSFLFRAGYNVPLGDHFSLWPQLGIGAGFITTNNNGGTYGLVPLDLYVPLMAHPAQHFTLGLGPGLHFNSLTNNDIAGLGIGAARIDVLRFTIGGWL